MPCYTRVQSKVEFLATSTDVGLLAESLKELGHTVQILDGGLRFSKFGRVGSYDKTTGKLTAPDTLDTADVKRGYSEQVVNATARKNGWKIAWSVNAEGNRTAEVIKRSY